MTYCERFDVLQEQQKAWVLHNFGQRPSWMPFAGVVEEIGELRQALRLDQPHLHTAEVFDACADVVIFAADLCTALGMSLESEWQGRNATTARQDPSIPVGQLAHAFLKRAQQIRGTDAEHEEAISRALRQILGYVDAVCFFYGRHLPEVVWEVWAKVRQRDFKARPGTG